MTLCRLNKLGTRFCSEKQQALLRGDTSGTVIEPFFIHAAQSLGMHFCEDVGSSPPMIRLQAKNVQRSLESLVDTFKGQDWELIAQVALWVAAGSIAMRLGHITHAYIKKSCEAIDTARLRFIPTYGRPPEFSEHLHEKLSVLSQTIYFENFLFLACGGAEPTLTARIEKEFRHRLQVRSASSWLFTPRVHRSLAGSLSGIVQHLSVDHAHADHLVGQRHGGYARPSSDRRYVLIPSAPTAPIVNCVTRDKTWCMEAIMRSTGGPSGQPFSDPPV